MSSGCRRSRAGRRCRIAPSSRLAQRSRSQREEDHLQDHLHRQAHRRRARCVEKENPKLKGVLNKTYTQLQIDPANLSSLIDLIATIPFEHADLHAKDILGHVYEYFLGQFALAEGKKGGQYFTPKSIVSLIVEMLEPYQGRVYDPAMGSGGFFVQSERFIEEHGGKLGNLSVYGQESNPTTWRLAAMNMAIRGIDFNFGKEPANSFTSDQHPDLRADYVMANPPFNISEWWDAKLEGDPRWRYGTPPKGQRELRLDPAHAPSPRPAGQHGAPPRQWLHEQRFLAETAKRKPSKCVMLKVFIGCPGDMAPSAMLTILEKKLSKRGCLLSF
jgi:hypothetical protein